MGSSVYLLLNPALNEYHAKVIEDIFPIIDNFDVKYTIIILFDELEISDIYFCVIHQSNRFSTVYNSSKINFSLILIFNPFFLDFMENRPKSAEKYRKFGHMTMVTG